MAGKKGNPHKYTLCPKKARHLMFDNNFGKCGSIFKFFHQLIREKIFYVHTQRLSPHLRYVATLPCESRKSKNVTDFTVSSTNC